VALEITRRIEPMGMVRYLGNLPHDDAAIREWEQPGDFAAVAESKVEGTPDPAFWPSLPGPVVSRLVELAAEAVPAIEPERRVVRHHLDVRTASAVYALYAFNEEEYDCWLLGPQGRLLAPSNPITQQLGADLEAVERLIEAGDHAGAGELLQRCRAMGQADPFCRKRLGEAEAHLEESAGGPGRRWVLVGGGVAAALVVVALAWMLLG
jgi:hypothetical protein